MKLCSLYWPIKIVVFSAVCWVISAFFQPKNVCFDVPLAIKDGKMQVNGINFVQVPDKSYFLPGHFCINLDLAKHQFCPQQRLTASEDDLCLAQTREITAIFFQLFSTVLLDAIHLVFLIIILCNKTTMNAFTVAIPLLQVATLTTVFLGSLGIKMGWASHWSRAGIFQPPSSPIDFNLLVFIATLASSKAFETFALARVYVEQGFCEPQIIVPKEE